MKLRYSVLWAADDTAAGKKGEKRLKLSPEQKERYERNILLKDVGIRGQEKLLAGSVLIIGAGGLGSPAALYLAAAGVGTIGIADSDAVGLSNLQRQILHNREDLGKPKVFSARRKINLLNEDTDVIPYHEKIDGSSLDDILSDRGYEFVIDATDNFESKFMINDSCVKKATAFVHAGVLGTKGQAMTYIPGKGPCFRCVFQNVPKPGEVPSCREEGILGAVAGTLGTIQAAEAVKYLAGFGQPLCGSLLIFDALSMSVRKIKVSRRKSCPACSGFYRNLQHIR